jgi:hypothetical protein
MYSHAEAYLDEGARSRTVLVGDAAHTVHPLAGQGLDLSLGDVECLAQCITQTLKHGGQSWLVLPWITGLNHACGGQASHAVLVDARTNRLSTFGGP